MSSAPSNVFASLFGSDLPRWACEFTPDAVVVVGAAPDRKQTVSKATVPLTEGAITPGLKGTNIADPSRVQSALGRALDESGFSGSDLVVVIPDDAVRIALVGTESFPSSPAEQESFIRWKLKKNVPFDVSTARVAFEKQGENGVVNVLTALAPETVTAEYESLVDGLGLHPGVVGPSSTAALNLLSASPSPTTDFLFLKLARTAVVTAILGKGNVSFYRKVSRRVSIDDAIYPTLMYYQDKLTGGEGTPGPGIRDMVVCSEGGDREEVRAAASKLGLEVGPLYSADLEDVYKPALGALQ